MEKILKKNKVALLAGIILLVLIFFIIFGPAISGYGYEKIDSGAINQGPSAAHWFGTDDLGRDLFARVWQAGRVSLLIGITGALVASLIGSIYGGIAAYFGGIVDDIMMRIVEVLLSIPYLLIVILISVMTDSKSLGTMLIALTLTGWCGIARLVRGQMHSAEITGICPCSKCTRCIADENYYETYDSKYTRYDYRSYYI